MLAAIPAAEAACSQMDAKPMRAHRAMHCLPDRLKVFGRLGWQLQFQAHPFDGAPQRSLSVIE